VRFTVKACFDQVVSTGVSGYGLIGSFIAIAANAAIIATKMDTDVLFECPPLEAGKSYDLWFVKSTGAERDLSEIQKGTNVLMLTEHDEFITDGLAILKAVEKGRLNMVHQQEFKK